MGKIKFDMYIPNLICFTGNPTAKDMAIAELNRVGFDNVNVHWSFPNPFDRKLLSLMPHTKMFDGTIGFFNCSRMHYRIIKTAYELGDDYVFICEDDCRFMKSIADMKKALKCIPEADVLLFDCIPPKKGVETPLRKINEYWSEFDEMRSGACYVLSRAGMERLIWLYESPINPKINHRFARICDQWFNRKMLGDLKLVAATPNIAIQQTMPSNRNSGNEWRLSGYNTLGIDIANYAEY